MFYHKIGAFLGKGILTHLLLSLSCYAITLCYSVTKRYQCTFKSPKSPVEAPLSIPVARWPEVNKLSTARGELTDVQ